MTDRMKPMSKAWHQRQRVWRHNAFSGHVRMMQMQLQAIATADSTDEPTKKLARALYAGTAELAIRIKTRIDP